jgi:hypothetical protein
MRVGDSAYWLHNLNKHHPANSFVIITDPMVAANDLLMKPFTQVSKIKTFYSAFDQNLTHKQLNRLINEIQPKHLIIPLEYMDD